MAAFTRREIIAATVALMGTSSAKADAITEGFAPVPGGKIYWKKVGTGSKTPLLTLHGGPGAAHNYLLPLAALADARPVIFYDQLGCGKAEAPTDEKLYTIQRSVEELEAVRGARGLDKVILFGHSWGSMLAIEYLCQGRGKGIDTLILGGALASVPQAMAGQQRLIAQMPNGEGDRLHTLEKAGKTESAEYAALVQKFYDQHVIRVKPSADAQASFAALGKSIAYRVMNGPNEFTITGIMKDWNRIKDLKAITHRTLLTTGEFDEITLDCHKTILHGISGPTQLKIFKGCSHLTMTEKPKEYVATLRRFLG